MSIDQGGTSASSAASAPAQGSTTRLPGVLFLGVIVWADDPEIDPTVIADRNPVAVARAVAVTIHEMLEDSEAYGNAEPLVDSFPYPARQAGCFMMVSNSMGVNFPSLR